jgi:hypothetical protein
MNLAVAPLSDFSTAPARTASDLKVAAVLGVACAAGTALTVPYSNAVLPAAHLGQGAAAIASLGQGGVLFLLAWAGLRMGRSLGLDAPRLRAWLAWPGGGIARGDHEARALGRSMALGAALGVVTVLLAYVLPTPVLASPLHVARWQGLLASLGGPVVEEVACRLFAMTALSWCLSKAFPGRRRAVLAASNALAALAFAALHLSQATALFGTLTPSLLVAVVAGNGIVGLGCGELFRAKGLGHAIAAHFGADLVLHVLISPV